MTSCLHSCEASPSVKDQLEKERIANSFLFRADLFQKGGKTILTVGPNLFIDFSNSSCFL